MANDFKARDDEYKPRERMMSAASPSELRPDELLAILLRTGAAGCDVQELSRRLIASYASIEELVKSDWRSLKEHIRLYNVAHPDRKIVGIGKVKLIELSAAFELVRRGYDCKKDDIRKLTVSTPGAVYEVFRKFVLSGDEQETFLILPVDAKCHPLSEPIRIMRGTVDAAPFHPREVFRDAIRWGAHAIFVAHNHPHGDVTPSPEDLELTRELVETASVVGIPVLDHLILGSSRVLTGRKFVSLKQSGRCGFKW